MRKARLHHGLAVATALAAALFATSAAAEPIASDIATCSADNSTPTAIEDVRLKAPEDLPRCVAVQGLILPGESFPFVIYDGVDALYASQTTFRTGQVFYAGGPSSLAPWHPMPVVLYGRPDVCHAPPIQPDGEIMMVECWHPLIHVDAFDFTGPPPVRLTGEAERVRVGNLTLAPRDWPARAAARAAFDASMDNLLAAGVPGAEPVEGSALATLRLKLDGYAGDAPFAPEPVFFIARKPLPHPEYDPRPETAPSWNGLACVCLIESCDGLWPISTIDADNGSMRPYACLPVRGWSDRADIDIVQPSWNGLLEPSRSRQ